MEGADRLPKGETMMTFPHNLRRCLTPLGLSLALSLAVLAPGNLGTTPRGDEGGSLDPWGWTTHGDEGGSLDPWGWTARGDEGGSLDPWG